MNTANRSATIHASGGDGDDDYDGLCTFGLEDAVQGGLLSSAGELEELYRGDKDKKNECATDDAICEDHAGLSMLLASARQVQSPPVKKSKTAVSSSGYGAIPVPKEKSLGKLSQRFLQLFLMGYKVVGMTKISDRIIGPSTFSTSCEESFDADKADGRDGSPVAKSKTRRAAFSRGLKTKIRRLYDIANILASLDIIEKINSGNNMSSNANNRPSFRWIWGLSPRDILEARIASVKERVASSNLEQMS